MTTARPRVEPPQRGLDDDRGIHRREAHQVVRESAGGVVELGLREPGADREHADLRLELDVHRFGEREHERLRRGVDAEVRDRLERRRRCDVDDRAARAGVHVGAELARENHRRLDVHAQHLADRVGASTCRTSPSSGRSRRCSRAARRDGRRRGSPGSSASTSAGLAEVVAATRRRPRPTPRGLGRDRARGGRGGGPRSRGRGRGREGARERPHAEARRRTPVTTASGRWSIPPAMMRRLYQPWRQPRPDPIQPDAPESRGAFGGFIGPKNLLSLVRNTAPYLFDGSAPGLPLPPAHDRGASRRARAALARLVERPPERRRARGDARALPRPVDRLLRAVRRGALRDRRDLRADRRRHEDPRPLLVPRAAARRARADARLHARGRLDGT